MFVTVIFLATLVAVAIVWEYRRRQSLTWKQLSKFPGDYPWPLIGNAFELGLDSDRAAKQLVEIWKRHGKNNCRVTVGTEAWILFSEPDDIGTILSHPTELGKPPERNAAMMPFFGYSVSTSEGERWRVMRKLMTPSFHFKTLDSRAEVVNTRCGYIMQVLDKHVDKGPVDLCAIIRPMMFDMLCTTLMGVDYEMMKQPDHPYFKAVGRVVDLVTRNYFSYWRKIDILFKLSPSYKEMLQVIKTIREMSFKIVEDRRNVLQKMLDSVEREGNIKHKDMELQELMRSKLSEDACLLDTLMLSKFPDGRPITDEMIVEEISLLCFTGQYTTAMTVCHTLYCLAKYPEIQEKVMEEQRAIFGSDNLKYPNNQELNDMKYLEAVIKESMRYIPTVPKLGRTLKEDLTLKDGRIVPAGTTVIVFLEALYLNDKVYPEPERFDPNRFLEKRQFFEFASFSAGPRNCVGFRLAWLAMKATISNILRRFEMLPGGPGTTPNFASRLITESTNGVRLNIKRRINAH